MQAHIRTNQTVLLQLWHFPLPFLNGIRMFQKSDCVIRVRLCKKDSVDLFNLFGWLCLPMQEFLDGCVRLKGSARSMDVHAVLADTLLILLLLMAMFAAPGVAVAVFVLWCSYRTHARPASGMPTNSKKAPDPRFRSTARLPPHCHFNKEGHSGNNTCEFGIYSLVMFGQCSM